MAICKFEMCSLLMLMFCFIVVHLVQQNVNIVVMTHLNRSHLSINQPYKNRLLRYRK